MSSYAPGFTPYTGARNTAPVQNQPYEPYNYNVPTWKPYYSQVRPGTWVNQGRGFAINQDLHGPVRNPYALNQWRKKWIPGYSEMSREERFENANPQWTDVYHFDGEEAIRVEKPLINSPAWIQQQRNMESYNRMMDYDRYNRGQDGRNRIAYNRFQAQDRWNARQYWINKNREIDRWRINTNKAEAQSRWRRRQENIRSYNRFQAQDRWNRNPRSQMERPWGDTSGVQPGDERAADEAMEAVAHDDTPAVGFTLSTEKSQHDDEIDKATGKGGRNDSDYTERPLKAPTLWDDEDYDDESDASSGISFEDEYVSENDTDMIAALASSKTGTDIHYSNGSYVSAGAQGSGVRRKYTVSNPNYVPPATSYVVTDTHKRQTVEKRPRDEDIGW